MGARAIGSGTISFGLVSIPVKLYASAQPQATISFNLLHATCKSRLKQQYVCPKDDVVVGRDEIVKGYEFAKDQYVTFTDEELAALEEQASEAIEITEFLPLAAIDPVYYDKAYYLGPDKGADKAYRLLAEALRETGRAALARYAARGRQYLVLLRPMQIGLVMQQLRYADEVKSMGELGLVDTPVKDAELELAKALITRGASDEFHPERYRDEVKERVQALIRQKVEGHEITAAPTVPPRAQIIDLMEALKASLAGGPKGTAKAPVRAGVKRAAERPTRIRAKVSRK